MKRVSEERAALSWGKVKDNVYLVECSLKGLEWRAGKFSPLAYNSQKKALYILHKQDCVKKILVHSHSHLLLHRTCKALYIDWLVQKERGDTLQPITTIYSIRFLVAQCPSKTKTIVFYPFTSGNICNVHLISDSTIQSHFQDTGNAYTCWALLDSYYTASHSIENCDKTGCIDYAQVQEQTCFLCGSVKVKEKIWVQGVKATVTKKTLAKLPVIYMQEILSFFS